MKIKDLTPEDAVKYVLDDGAETTVRTFEQWSKLSNQNLGQLWCDLLTVDDKIELMTSPWDPYHAVRWEEILIALNHLLDPDFYKSMLLEAADHAE